MGSLQLGPVGAVDAVVDDGAAGRVGAERGGRWPRQRRRAAMNVLGRSGE